jgi:D-3-phosphoglycerate dehydrogenase
MANFTVYVAEKSYSDYSQERSIITRMGGDLRFASCSCEEDIISRCCDADAILLRQTPLGKRALGRLRRLKVIARYGTGYDNVDVDAATVSGVVVTIVPDYCIGEVADHAAALLLASIRKLTRRDRAVRGGEWDLTARLPVSRTEGRILGLVGYGKTAREFRKRMSGFPFRVAVCSPRTDPDALRRDGIIPLDYYKLLLVSDYVSLHVPLNDETRHMVDADALRRMRRRAILINTSRGSVVDQEALHRALTEGRIAGAALDVYEDEPLHPSHPLCSLEQVILTDHAAWYSEESREELQRRTALEAMRVLNGLKPENAVNPEALGRRDAPRMSPERPSVPGARYAGVPVKSTRRS